jgi:pimeloyl-ACP methyl ester carboxylesterase
MELGAAANSRQHRSRVSALVLIEPTLLAVLPPPLQQKVTQGLEHIIRTAERDGGIAGLRANIAWLGGQAWTRLDETMQEARLQALAPLAPITIPHCRGLIHFPVTDDDVRSLGPRTLLLYGTNSYDFEPAIAQRFRELRPDLPLVIVEGAGHNLHRERPDIVNAAILDFLAR